MEARLAALVRRDSSLQVQQAGHGEAGECIDPSIPCSIPCLRRRNPSLNLSAKISVCAVKISVKSRWYYEYRLHAKICNLNQISVVISVKISL